MCECSGVRGRSGGRDTWADVQLGGVPGWGSLGRFCFIAHAAGRVLGPCSVAAWPRASERGRGWVLNGALEWPLVGALSGALGIERSASLIALTFGHVPQSSQFAKLGLE